MIYIVLSDYCDRGFFGAYSSLLKAEEAITDFIARSPELTYLSDLECAYVATDGNQAYNFIIRLAEIDPPN